MKIALFSDVHGSLRIVLHLVRCWQMTHRAYLDGALIAGDLGCFPDITKVDKATRRWITRDPEQAGFSTYFVHPQPAVERMFEREHGEFSDVRCPIFFVPGNHEDFDFLNEKRKQSARQTTFTVDCYRRFSCIQDGSIICITGHDGKQLRVAGVWGIENTTPNAPYRINPKVVQYLESLGPGHYDLLLTHDAPADASPIGVGSKQISGIIGVCKPPVHVFGHVHPAGNQHELQAANSQTRSFILKNVSFGKDRSENLCRALGLLDWDGTTAKLSIIADDWLSQMQYHTWQHVLPGIPHHAQRNASPEFTKLDASEKTGRGTDVTKLISDGREDREV